MQESQNELITNQIHTSMFSHASSAT